MRVAVFADIHGNCVAFDAVLADIEAERVDALVCLGDVVEGGPQPMECLERLRELDCPVVLGNTDEWLLEWETEGVEAARVAQGQWTRARLGDDGLAFLRSFVPSVEVGDILCFHGSPRSNTDLVQPTTPDAELADMLEGVDAPVLTGGHIHLQWVRRFLGSVFFNPGSVGMANDFKRAARELGFDRFAEYALVAVEGERLSLDLRRVPYDVDRIVDACRTSGMPAGERAATRWQP